MVRASYLPQLGRKARTRHGLIHTLMLSDLRYAVRSLRHAWGFTLVVVLTLGLGIGAAAAIFSMADWVLFRSDPYPQKQQLFVLGMKNKGESASFFLFGHRFQSYQKLTDVFAEFSAENTSQPKWRNIFRNR